MKFTNIYIVALVMTILPTATWACDNALATTRDCQIQDRYRNLKSSFSTMNVNLNDIAEYKAIRFIDRKSWETAKAMQTPPKSIYNPAPMTWNIWSNGMDSLNSENLALDQLRVDAFSKMNRILLTDGVDNVKDDRTDEAKAPGEIRGYTDAQVGFCSHEVGDHKAMAESSLQSMLKLQSQIEKALNISFQTLVTKESGVTPGLATMGVTLRGIAPGCGPDGTGIWVSYTRSELVAGNMDWIRILIKTYSKNAKLKQILRPIEFAALIQKWFVTVHPFADGNGRTSRALQDIILETFDLPYAPGGDLQNDALEEYTKYIANNYAATEAMLTKLESCEAEYKSQNNQISFGCQTVQKLNN
jgi:hypothetical protein